MCQVVISVMIKRMIRMKCMLGESSLVSGFNVDHNVTQNIYITICYGIDSNVSEGEGIK